MKKITYLLITCIFIGCAKPESGPITEVEVPTGDNSSLPRLVTAANGQVYLSWVEKGTDKKSELKFSRLSTDSWERPQLIAAGDNWFVNWADFPSLSVNQNTMAAHWLQKSDLGTYDYDVRLSFSQNGGESWGQSLIPHKDGVAAEHGFVSMLPMANEETFVTWLDGRNTKNETAPNAMTLRAGFFDRNGATLQEWELDNRICDCCQTAAAMTSLGPVVVYRDRSENEIRDMSIVRLVGGEWTQPQPVAIELWEIAGCPVNGPAMSAQGLNVAVAWFTAKNGFAQVKLAFSANAGATFTTPVVVSEGATNGRVGISHLPNGDVAVSWMDTKDDKAQVMVARYDGMGILINKLQVAETSAERASGFPVITSQGEQVWMAWTETGESPQVKTAKINL